MARLRVFTIVLYGGVFGGAALVFAQDSQTPPAGQNPPSSSSATQNPPPGGQTTAPASTATNVASERRFFYGFRIVYFPLRQFDTSARQSESTNPVADYTYQGSSSAQKGALAGSFEYVITRRLSAGVEFYLTHATYTLTTNVRTGLPSPNSSTDDRPVTMYVQSNKANYWDLPLIARYQGIRSKGLLSHAYWLVGPEYRHVGRVRTGTDIFYPDGTTGYNEIPTVPTHRNQVGALVGVGWRFFDQFGFKVTPELRYVRWNSDAFQVLGAASTKNEVSAALGFSF
ncbi:MAG TPA: hypothetical protein VMB85_14235 [Bryobacteraceae bacterium]|jgi:hypothetical protein|nr:hypothetical protein [Bryobacteraceae bacterium]